MAKDEYCEDGNLTLMALKEPGLLYIIQEGESDEYFKVGVTKNEDTLKSRLQNLQSGNWRKLTLKQKSKVNNMNLAESFAHNELKAYNIKAGGGTEWFKTNYQTVKDAFDKAVSQYPPK